MKKLLTLAAALCLCTSTALAGAGIDLSLGACPGNPGAEGLETGPVDCAGTASVTVFGTWAPAEDIPDLVALDCVLDAQVSGDLDVNSFWNFAPNGCNFVALTSSHAFPATGCSTPNAYTDTWNPTGSGSAASVFRLGPGYERIAISCYRTDVLSVVAQQKMFGMQIVIDGRARPGDVCPGCSAGFCLRWTEASPRSVEAVSPTDLYFSTGNFPGFDNTLSFNGANSSLCDFAVPTKRHTWGELKSLYR